LYTLGAFFFAFIATGFFVILRFLPSKMAYRQSDKLDQWLSAFRKAAEAKLAREAK
jgi:hypothetical protein